MDKKTVDTDLLSKERQDIFDEYYSHIESIKLRHIKTQSPEKLPDFETLVKSLTILDRNIEDLAAVKNIGEDKFEAINRAVIASLKEWYELFQVLIKEPKFIKAFSYNLQGLAVLIFESRWLEILEVQKDVIFLSPSRTDKQEYDNTLKKFIKNESSGTKFARVPYSNSYTFYTDYLKQIIELVKDKSKEEMLENIQNILNELEQTEKNYATYRMYREGKYPMDETILILVEQINKNYGKKIFPFISLPLTKQTQKIEIDKYREILNRNKIHYLIEKIRQNPKLSFEWDFTFIIKDDENKYDSAQIGFLMWSLSKALNAIDGVEVILEDWGNGSKKFSIKVIIKDFLAKEEVKQVIDKARQAAEAQYLDKPIQEADKIKAEKEKIVRETESLPGKEVAKAKQELEIMHSAADLAMKKIQIIKELSALAKDGILINDSDVQCFVNDLLLFHKKDGQFMVGAPMDLIEEKEVRNDKTENKDKPKDDKK